MTIKRLSLPLIILAVLVIFSSCKKEFRKGKVINQELLNSAGHDLPGYKIAFTDLYNIYIMNADGTDAESLTTGGKISGYVSWSEDAEYVYFAGVHSSEANAAWEAYRVHVGTKELTQISKFDVDVRSLGVSPDGETMAISVMTGNSNVGNNNNNLTQFSTNLYTVPMSVVEAKLVQSEYITMSDLTVFQSSPNDQQFWYEEIDWNHDPANPILAYSKTWRYDEDAVSYTHVYTIKPDGSDNVLLAENQDQPIWSIDSDKLSFLGLGYYDFTSNSLNQVNVSGIKKEVSGGSFSPMGGKYILFEIGDRNRRGGLAKTTKSTNEGAQFPYKGIYEPRWSPVPVD